MGIVLRVGLSLVFAVAAVGLAPAAPQAAGIPQSVTARETSIALAAQAVVELPAGTTHIALRWHGSHDAAITIELSEDGRRYGAAIAVAHDEAAPDHAGPHEAAPGEQDREQAEEHADEHAREDADRPVHSGVLPTQDARHVRLTSDTPIGRVTVTTINANASAAHAPAFVAAAAVEQPAIISRAEWGANESWRFDSAGTPVWPEEFFAIQKLIVHHTAGANDDPNPAATVRAIQYYQAVTRGWGDVGYNFLIDEQGRIYEGRYSREYADTEIPSGTDLNGHGVQGGHVLNYNSGTVGIALLGNLVDQDATPAARAALEWLLAWLSELHGIDPRGDGLYVNPHPDGTTQKHNPNISGHRDWAATACPGGTFYASLPHLRQAVAARVAGEPPPPAPQPATVPAAPELTAFSAPKARGVRLHWTAPDDGGAPISGYRILRKKKSRFVRVATVGPSTTTWRDRNTRRGRTYTYVVRAVNSEGAGPRSNQASAPAS